MTRIAPLSFSQERLWFLEQLEPGTAVHHIVRAWRLQGSPDRPAIRRALDALCRRHEILLTVYESEEGVPFQRVIGAQPPFAEDDWSGLSRETHLLRLQRFASRPFDLTSAPPFRCLLTQISASEHILLFVFHHIAFDGWSISIFLSELAVLYAAEPSKVEAVLPPLPFQFATYSIQQRDRLTPEVLNQLAAPWIDRLAGARDLLLPRRELPPGSPRVGGKRRRFTIEASLAAEARRLARSCRATAFSVYLAAFNALLFRYCGVDEFCVGTPSANRDHPDLERLVGFFVTTVVVRASLGGDPSFSELVRRTADSTLDALADAAMPFEHLVQRLPLRRDSATTPVFQAMFVYQSFPAAPLGLSGLDATPFHVPTHTAPFDLSLYLYPGESGVECWLEFADAAFDEATAALFSDQYHALLRSSLEKPGEPLSRLEYLSAASPSTAGSAKVHPQAPAATHIITARPGDPPLPGVEQQIAAIWRRLLGLASVSRADNFFDIGGHSLAAVRMVSMIEKEFGRRLPVSTVFAAPVLESLAVVVSRGAEPARSSLIPLQPAGFLPPVLSLSAGPRFRSLARSLDCPRPVLAIPEPDPSSLPHPCRCEDLAAQFAERVLHHSPRGPWILSGWCLSGVVAFETARLLSSRGSGAVLLLDSPCPVLSRNRTTLQNMRRALDKAAYHARVILEGRHGGLLPYVAERIRTIRDQRALASFGRRYEDQVNDGSPADLPSDLQLLMNHAASLYSPASPLAWPVLLVRANERAGDRPSNPDWGWQPWAPALDVVWVDGDHGTIFEDPFVTETARQIREWLNHLPSKP